MIDLIKEYVTIPRIIGFVIVVLCIVFLLSAYMSYGAVASSYESSIDNLNTQIEDTNRLLEQASSQTSVDGKEVTTSITNATEVGNKVAELQTKYSTIDVATQSDLMKQNANALKECFYDESGTGDWQTPWFSYGDKKVTWEFKTTYGYTVSNVNTINVLWEAYQEGNSDMVAYAMGVYDGTQKKFTSIKHYVTDAGNKIVNSAVDDNSQNSASLKEEVDNMIKRMKELEGKN